MLILEIFFLNIHYQIIVALYRQWNTIYVLKLAQNFRYLILSLSLSEKQIKARILNTDFQANYADSTFVTWPLYFNSSYIRICIKYLFCTVFLVTLLLYIGLCKQLALQIYICEFTSFNKNASDYILLVRRCQSLLLQLSNRTTTKIKISNNNLFF